MKEGRLQVFRAAIDGLIESLEAVIRLSRWSDADGESKPDPLVKASSKLLERLGTASRLASSRFLGSATEAGKVDAMCAVLRKLDAAYLAYRQQLDSPSSNPTAQVDAIAILETEVAGATAGAMTWR